MLFRQLTSSSSRYGTEIAQLGKCMPRAQEDPSTHIKNDKHGGKQSQSPELGSGEKQSPGAH